jgi:MtrB/PioB family decaheme-associated outer membrane protein
MTNRQDVSSLIRSGCLSLPLLLLGPTAAMGAAGESETENRIYREFEIGAYLLSDDSYRFGKYTGLTEEGAEPLFNFLIEKKPVWNSGDTVAWSLEGGRLGLDSRFLEFEYADMGVWEFGAHYLEIPNNRFADGQTPFVGVGTDSLTLPGDWVAPPGGGTSSFDKLADSLLPLGVQTQRKRLELEYERYFDRNWAFEIEWRHENKEGLDTLGGLIGNGFRGARSALLPVPIDWDTDIMEASLDFGNQRFQFGFSVYASWFQNNTSSLSWQNPFGRTPGWDFGVAYPSGYGRYGAAPDNEAIQYRVYGGINLTPTTRLSANLSFGSMDQDETLLAYTVNPALQVDTPLPRSGADTQVDTTHANVRFSARPFSRLNLLLNYTLDERDNETPQDTWVYVSGDSEDQKNPQDGRINLPYSYERTSWDATATWRIARGLRLKGGAEFNDYSRTYSEVLDSDETRYFLGLSLRQMEKLTFSADLARSERDVDGYVGNRPLLLTSVPGTVDADDYTNVPALRKYNQTDRRRDEYRLRADFYPVPRFSFALTASQFEDEYNETDNLYGLQTATVKSWTADFGIYPTERLSLTAYYTLENYESRQNGNGWFNRASAGDPRFDWQTGSKDEVDTWNAGLRYEGGGEGSLISDRIELGMDYTYSNVESDIEVTATGLWAGAPLPTLVSKLQSWTAYARLRINDRSAVRLSYEQQQLTSSDFGLDQIPVDGQTSVLLLGQSAANYDLSLVMLSWSYSY